MVMVALYRILLYCLLLLFDGKFLPIYHLIFCVNFWMQTSYNYFVAPFRFELIRVVYIIFFPLMLLSLSYKLLGCLFEFLLVLILFVLLCNYPSRLYCLVD